MNPVQVLTVQEARECGLSSSVLRTMSLPTQIRCYDGAFDSATQRALNAQAASLRKIQAVHPGAHVTYFPMEGCWQVHVWGRPLSDFHATKAAALRDANAHLLRRVARELS